MDIAWADVLRAALSFFLVVVGIGIAYVCFRLGAMIGKMTLTVGRVTDEVVPILSRAQTTVDGINLELQRVDEIMVSAVNATKGAEKTVTSLSHAVTTPVKKVSGFSAAIKEAVATFRAKRASPPAPEAPPAAPAPTRVPEAATLASDADAATAPIDLPADVNGPVEEVPAEVRDRTRGPSISQIAWALPKRRA